MVTQADSSWGKGQERPVASAMAQLREPRAVPGHSRAGQECCRFPARPHPGWFPTGTGLRGCPAQRLTPRDVMQFPPVGWTGLWHTGEPRPSTAPWPQQRMWCVLGPLAGGWHFCIQPRRRGTGPQLPSHKASLPSSFPPSSPPRTHLCQGSDAVVHVGQDGWLIAHLEVEVDNFVGEGGELVAEAEGVDTLDVSVVGEAVILLLGLLVDGLAVGVLHVAVHIIVPSADHLCGDVCVRWHTPSDVARAPDLPSPTAV